MDKPGGMETINKAIEVTESQCPEADWALVNVGVAPSTITITFADPKRSPIDCRVRFLSFLGIGKDSRKCAFVGKKPLALFENFSNYNVPSIL